MLDKELTGCTVLMFMQPMDMSVRGRIYLDGKPVENYVYKFFESFHIPIIGIKLRGYITEYGQKTTIRAEGFKDIHGTEMEPAEFVVTGIERVAPLPEYAEHERVALQAAEEGIVLLKNDNELLPLQEGSILNFFGKGLYDFRVTAVGAGRIHARYTVCLREAIEEKSSFQLNADLDAFYKNTCEDVIPSEEMIDDARNKNDLAFVVISRASGENIDNFYGKGGCLLDDYEEALIEKVTSEFSKTVLILNTGYPIDLTFLDKYRFDAIVYNGFGGMLAGEALVKVLDGRVSPSGKLPFTWAKRLEDIPADRNFYKYGNKGNKYFDGDSKVWINTVYEEDIYVGYRYFDTFGCSPAFPFGYGLSYTKFTIDIENTECFENTKVKLKVKVTNTGKRAGKEVVQIYVQKPEGKIEKPLKELVYFDKTNLLEPLESQTLEMEIPVKYMTCYDEERAAYILEAGNYTLLVGNSSGNVSVCTTFTVEKTIIIKQVKNRLQPLQNPVVLSKYNKTETYPDGKHSGINTEATTIEPIAQREEYPVHFDTTKTVSERLTFADVRNNPDLLTAFINQLSVEELVRLAVCSSASWGMENIGEAGRLYRIEGRELPKFIVADGNSGVNIKKRNIGMPSGVTLCASFNKQLMELVGRVIGEEAKENGVNLILAPGMNIQRHPLNGRHPEYFSEDPYLSGTMAGHYNKGMQSTGVGGCFKHCIANNCETARKRNQSIMSERALREIYFRNFEIAMDISMPTSIMTAYNGVNGKPTSTDPDLILGLFREECGFDGYVMTDWATYDSVDVLDMVNAGNCWITPASDDDTYTKPIIEGVKSGKVNLDRLRESVFYLLKTVAKLV